MPNLFTPPSDDVCLHFISTPLNTLLTEYQTVNPEDKVLALFYLCVEEVPAYRRFLEERGLNPAKIISELFFASEVFSEEWHSLMGQRIGSVSPCQHTASL